MENDPEKGNKILEWKAEKGSKDCQPKTSLRDPECFTPLLEQLTMKAIRISATEYSKAIVLHRRMNQNQHSTLPWSTNKIKAIIFEPISLPWRRMKSGSHYWKLLKTIPSAKLAFQSYTIQTYLWFCSSAKWLPERENSWFIQISIDSTSAKNVVYTQSLSKCPGNKWVPVRSFVYIHEEERSHSVATECE